MKRLLFILFCLMAHQLVASHLLGGYINYRSLQNQKYEITVHLLLDSHSEVQGGDGVVDFGDGFIITGGFNNTEKESLGDISILTFSVTHTYSGYGSYTVSYFETNYNVNIINIEGSASIPLFISARIENDPAIGENSSPELPLFSNQNGISKIKQKINPAAYDVNNDSLSYALIVPSRSEDQKLQAYTFPNDTAYYNNYQSGNEEHNGIPTYDISPASGEIVWNAPGMLGEYAIAYQISEWRKIAGLWSNIGETEVILIDRISDALPELSIEGPESQCYDNISEVAEQFQLEGPADEALSVNVFSDLPGAFINDVRVSSSGILNFELSGTLQLDYHLPSDITVTPFKPYKVIIRIEGPSETLTFSWAFAIGCDGLPENIPPGPIERDEDCETFTLYPNPVSGKIINICIPVKNDNLKHLRIVDMAGKLLFTQDMTASKAEIDIGGLHPGIYLLQVDQYARKFVVGM